MVTSIQKSTKSKILITGANGLLGQKLVEQLVEGGKFDVYICGDDMEAKSQVQQWLTEAFGYLPDSFVDLGGIANSRVTEGIVPFALALCIRKGVFRMGLRHII